MSKTAFSPANILLPRECGLTKWAVVACDQYTSQPEYWERVDKYVGDAPSTLRLILPESKLESDNVDQEIQKINHTMEQYLADGRLQELEDAMLLLERKLRQCNTAIRIRHGKPEIETVAGIELERLQTFQKCRLLILRIRFRIKHMQSQFAAGRRTEVAKKPLDALRIFLHGLRHTRA